jgi:type IV pilus biogenesis protein CpaD/CtpE
MLRNLGLLLGAAAMLVGCATIDPWGHRRNLEDAQRTYTRMVRWGDFLKASVWVDPDLVDRFMEDSQKLSDVRFTDYEIGVLDVEGDSASVRVQYQAYHAATLLEGTLHEKQDWYYEDGKWRVRPQLAGIQKGLAHP